MSGYDWFFSPAQPMLASFLQVKLHLNIPVEESDSDLRMQLYNFLVSAQDYINRYTGIANCADPASYDDGNIPGAIYQAGLMLVGHFYENREASIAVSGVLPSLVSPGVYELIDQYRSFVF